MTFLKRRIPVSALLLAIIIPTSIGGAYGLTTFVVTNFQTFATLNNQQIKVTGDLSVLQFNMTTAAQNVTHQCATCPGSHAHPANFTSSYSFVANDGISIGASAIAGTNLTEGDWIVRYIISTVGTTPSNQLYAVTLASNQSPTCGSTVGVCLFPTFYLRTPTGTTPNMLVLVFFDLGPVFAPLPTSFLLKVSPTT